MEVLYLREIFGIMSTHPQAILRICSPELTFTISLLKAGALQSRERAIAARCQKPVRARKI